MLEKHIQNKIGVIMYTHAHTWVIIVQLSHVLPVGYVYKVMYNVNQGDLIKKDVKQISITIRILHLRLICY